MIDPYQVFYHAAMALSLVASSLVFALMWRHRKANGALAMVTLSVATFIWTLCFLLEANSDTLERQLLFTSFGYLGSQVVPVSWLFFSINYTGERRIIIGWKTIPFILITIMFLVLVWTNDIHHLMWYDEHLTTSGAFIITAKTYGPLFWVMIIYDYLLVLIGAFILLRRLFVGTPLYTKQALSLITAIVLPLLWNIIYVFNLTSLPRKDLTPVMFAVSGFAIAYGLMRFSLFTAVPFARKYLITHLRDGILVFDSQHCLIEINPIAEKLLGMGKEIIGKMADKVSATLPLTDILNKPDFSMTEVSLAVSGEDKIYEIENVPMTDKENEKIGNLVILHDVTERKEMQEQLIAQDRLASIGELTSGVAHEINNPLAVIKGFTELLLKRDFPDDVKADINIINGEVDRAAKIVTNLLAFSRKQPEEKTPVDVNYVIEKTLELRSYEQTSNNIHTILELNPELPMVMGSELQLRQVFLNIIINAEYFMKEAHNKGILKISTEKAGNFIRIIFEDDGPGIPPENIKRIFNPFFTTKEVGKGTGLGLSICHGIVTEHQGNIWVESTRNSGARFIIILPVYKHLKR
ncbi:MAG: PAS domain S-box protein [Dehalococcoidales bacterium]|nr:PAS domain S-box protein [Dehalococcoidales bacterium]